MSSGYPIKMFQQVHKSLICNMCKFVIRDPTFILGGKQSVCKFCYIQSLHQIATEQVVITLSPDEATYNIIKNLKCYCKNRIDGCTELIKLLALTQHEEMCGYGTIKCDLCQQNFQRRNEQYHENDCALYICECGSTIKKTERDRHTVVCDKYIKCHQCQFCTLKSKFMEHIKIHDFKCAGCNLTCKDEKGLQMHWPDSHVFGMVCLTYKLSNQLLEAKIELEKVKEEMDILKARKDGSYILKIENVSKELKKAEQTNKPIYSPAFYSSQNGYKMRLEVYLNGANSAKGNHISIYFAILKGPWDDMLEWPFQEAITFHLISLHQSKEKVNHRSKIFKPSNNSSAYSKPVDSIDNPSAGCENFVSKEIFAGNEYIINDSMFVQIVVSENHS